MAKILIVNKEKAVLNNLGPCLEHEGYDVIIASHDMEALNRILEKCAIDAVIADLGLPKGSELELMQTVKQHDPEMGVILLPDDSDKDKALQLLKEGVYDCLVKPVDTGRLLLAVKRTTEHMLLVRENRRLSEALCKKDQYLHYINTHAAQILLNMAPTQLPVFDAVEVSAIYRSCECVGGDMYDIFELGSKTFFYLFDVCGHGILSAVITMILKNTFNNVKTFYEKTGMVHELSEIVKAINDDLHKNSASSLFATLFAGIYDRDEGVLTYVSAGHVDQYLVGGHGIKTLSSGSTVIGLFNDVCFPAEKVVITPTDRLYLFTDGITEIWQEECMLTCEDIADIIRRKHHKPLTESVNSIYENIISLYNGKAPEDDITIVGLEFKEI